MSRIIRLEEVDSTNSYVERNVSALSHGDAVVAHTQSAGRGQRGNSWESEPGLNLTFSMFLKPSLAANEQFALSSAVALAICQTIEETTGVICRVKWPNDIYAGNNKKICGILISHALQGNRIAHSIVGVGINVNQRVFRSNAPNPVSIYQLTYKTFECEDILIKIIKIIKEECDKLSEEAFRDDVALRYKQQLWRGDGNYYIFRETASEQTFEACVSDIESTGHLILLDTAQTPRRYAFKEVEWII